MAELRTIGPTVINRCQAVHAEEMQRGAESLGISIEEHEAGTTCSFDC